MTHLFKTSSFGLSIMRAYQLNQSGINRKLATVAVNAPAPDKLYRMVEMEVRGHDSSVLDSYEKFAVTAAQFLDIKVHATKDPWRTIERRTLLRAIFVHKDCREQYEYRTYYRIIQLKYLTGSTADTYLEYVQRNLPEGVSMRVTKHQLEKMLDHLVPPENSEANELQENK